jgi:two-component system, OmpR family, alkaline phosphatase synthesis response regulator PhoP
LGPPEAFAQTKEVKMSGKKRILVVDDEPDFAAIVQQNLEKEGFAVEVAYDGVEGLEKVHANPPDAIVLDVMMPEKDGYKVCAELKADERYAGIPIVLLTAVASHVTSTRYSHADGMSTEADDYLAKPASAEQITESIKELLGM